MTGSDMVSKEVAMLLYVLCGVGMFLVCAYDVIFGWLKDKTANLLKSGSGPKGAEPALRARKLGKS
jgi:hypothetical protein